MNRFRTKKKAKEEPTAFARSSSEDQHAGSSFKGFRKNKKSPEEEKVQFDLENALPPSDDFRTSLLMTGLSARFSMLREQDDPNTKIGKASDDSVLYSKRQSRILDIGFRGLDDIAEVESIRAPPFVRTDSFISDSDSTHGSIMTRNRPGEGNNLFGGRQKIYRIAAGQGGMGGRALYDDDVASSAFQKFKQREKDRLAQLDSGGEKDESDAVDVALAIPTSNTVDSFPRSDSPSPVGYNLRRETSSTTSSAARNSTAATSVVSQPSASGKESTPSLPSSASTPSLERNTTRARRLYEQGLHQDMHEHQSSALSRIDTLTGKRSLGRRTPDLSQSQSPSPTSFGFNSSAFSNSSRNLLSKASAPNLRSISPPTIPPPSIPINSAALADGSGLRSFSNGTDNLNRPAVSPPLSPPISDSGDQLHLPIQPGDHGKATAMGVFQKPTLPYDESRFAQRQLQLQHGRETPTQRFRTESNASYTTGVSSRSSSVTRRPQQSSESRAAPAPAAPPAPPASLLGPLGPSVKERAKTFLFDDDDEDNLPPIVIKPQSSASSLQRPSDRDHPAFRMVAAPKASVEPEQTLPIAERELMIPITVLDAAEDSPTLGPASGLNGLVRQHLRSTSNASSVYSTMAPQTHTYDYSESTDSVDMGMRANPWDEQDWKAKDQNLMKPLPTPSPSIPATPTPLAEEPRDTETRRNGSARSSDELATNEEDDFASQLANARRRVQERLTTYVESDGSRGPSPLLAPTETALPLPPAKSNPLGILRAKSSLGSLMDRSRDSPQPKAIKLLGLNSATMSTSPSPSKQFFDEKTSPASPAVPALTTPIPEENVSSQPTLVSTWDADVKRTSLDVATDTDADAESSRPPSADDEAGMHPGLRAFRNARRQLQKQKELEMSARHSEEGLPPRAQRSPPQERTQRGPDRNPPPVYHQQRDASQESWRSERDRSSSDTSNGGSNTGGIRTRPVPPRLRNPMNGPDGHYNGQHMAAPRSAGPALSPGLPGTDIRRSPHMPPQPYPGSAPQRSPIGSASMPPSPYYLENTGSSGRTTPTTAGPRMARPGPPQAAGSRMLDESMKKVVNKAEISEPTFVRSTSRVPTMNLPQSASAPDANGSRSRSGSQSRAGSNAGASGFAPPVPPVPPINPLRKQSDARNPRGMGSFLRRRVGEDGQPDLAASASTPQLSMGALAKETMSPIGQTRQYASSSDEEDMTAQRTLRHQASEGSRLHYRKMGAGLPPPRMDMPGGMI